jgi:carboxymethylenebutenolidase
MPEHFWDYISRPPAGTGPGVLVLHAWWGLNDTLRAFCDRLAGEGFVAYAPDLYHGRLAVTIEEAEALSSRLDEAGAWADIGAALKTLKALAAPQTSGLAVVGFSLGAFFALGASGKHPADIGKVVVYYGAGGGDFARSRASYLGHFAENDPYEPPENLAWLENELRQAGRPATFYTYPGTGHWFSEPDRTEAYHPAAAELAWERTLTFLRE